MASVTGLPEQPTCESGFRSETEPLLGRPRDAVLSERANIVRGPFIGTGIIAEIGVLILCCDIWANIASTPISFFSGHPIAMSIAIFTLIQSILFQQPITPENLNRKRLGQYIHVAFNLITFLAIITGFTIIEVSKAQGNGSHFQTTHAFFGVSTLLLLIVQYIVGFTMWLTPSLYGGEARAKSLYKYHRYTGYFILLMILGTAVTAMFLMEYNGKAVGVKFWVAGLGAFLIVFAAFPRIQKQKLGFGVTTT